MNDIVDQILMYLRGAWIYRWYIHLLAWPICIAGWAFVHVMPDQYESSAKIFVDTDSLLRPLLQGLAVGTDIKQQVALMTRTLLSRPNLEKVARMNDMDVKVTSPVQKDALIKELARTITITGSTDDNLYTITYVNESPQLAKEVVQSLLTIFIESSLGGSRTDTDSAQKFIDEQIKEYEARLVVAEAKLKEFKRKNLGLMPSDGQDYFQRLQSAIQNLESAKLELNEQTRKRDELKRQQLGEEPVFGIMSSTSVAAQEFSSSVDTRIDELEAKLDTLLLNYTENHPDVSALRRKIKELKDVREQEIAEKRLAAEAKQRKQASADISSNPIMQRMRYALSEAEANVAALQVRVREFEEKVAYLRKMVNIIPEVEAQLVQLNRDYEINKKNYEALIVRRESAFISEQAEETADTVKFQIVEPPIIPVAPVAPNRLLLSSVVIVLGVGIGIAFAFFLSQIRPTFHDRKSVVDNINAIYLGSVSLIRTSRQLLVRKIEIISFGLVFLLLMAVYAGYITFQILQKTSM